MGRLMKTSSAEMNSYLVEVDFVSLDREHLLRISFAELPITFPGEMKVVGVAGQSRGRNDIGIGQRRRQFLHDFIGACFFALLIGIDYFTREQRHRFGLEIQVRDEIGRKLS